MSPNDFIKHLTIYKTPWIKHSKEEQKSYLPYIMNVWLAMSPDLIEVVNEVQQQQVPNRDHYNFYLSVLPKKSIYFRWIKARKKEYSKDVIEQLSAFYSTSNREIYDSLCLLDKPKIISILQQTGLNDKQIKQLVK